jgi:hypothetical protein
MPQIDLHQLAKFVIAKIPTNAPVEVSFPEYENGNSRYPKCKLCLKGACPIPRSINSHHDQNTYFKATSDVQTPDVAFTNLRLRKTKGYFIELNPTVLPSVS